MHADGPIITLEEHFRDPAFAALSGGDRSRPSAMEERLEDFGGIRLREMDEAGIDIQVISHVPPGGQRLAPEVALDACRAVNDRLAAGIAVAPDRLAAFAALPTTAPEAAADELRRCIEDLGFRGALIHGLSNGRFLDESEFRPIFAAAAELDVPLYFHPGMPLPAVVEAYYQPYVSSHPNFARPAWGFGVETGTQAIRLVLSGLFDEHPSLKIILGHLGEGIPFQLSRIDEALSRPGNARVSFAEVFRRNFWVTTSGFFSDAALRCCLDELGSDRILFSIDWPAVPNSPGVDWLAAFPLDPADKARIFGLNALGLLRLNEPAIERPFEPG